MVIMALVEPVAFSGDGNYFASCANDGTLKVWNTVTGQIKQQYVPSSHLSAACSCLSWSCGQVDDVRQQACSTLFIHFNWYLFVLL